MMNDNLRNGIEQSVLCWLATVSTDGWPNVSPKEIFAPHGDAVVIADIASPVSVRNARANARVCVSFVDIFRQRGFKVAGAARVIAPDESDFQLYGEDLFVKAGETFRIRHVILVQIERVSPIKAPSYALFPGRSDDEVMQEAYRTYGVRPL